MEQIGLFYGSDTGCTEEITKELMAIWGEDQIVAAEISEATAKDFERFNLLILGLSTWYDGDLQSDWEDFYEEFKQIDFSNKTVALFGLGDQVGYGEYFIDGVGILAKVVLENGGEIVGHWPTDDYEFTESKAQIQENEAYFYGLAIDHDNQSEQNEERLTKWIEQVKSEIQALQKKMISH